MHKKLRYICKMYSKELIKGTLQTIILNLLSENEKMYGYEITSHVKALTKGKIILTEGALYPSLHKLEAEGLLKTETLKIGKRIRKYYSLTKKGSVKAEFKVNELVDFFTTMKNLISPNLINNGSIK